MIERREGRDDGRRTRGMQRSGYDAFLSVPQPVYVILYAKSIKEVTRSDDDTYTFTTDQGYGPGKSLFPLIGKQSSCSQLLQFCNY